MDSVSSNASLLAGLDRSVRVWLRTDEQIFAAEEQEKILEAKLDREVARSDMPGRRNENH